MKKKIIEYPRFSQYFDSALFNVIRAYKLIFIGKILFIRITSKILVKFGFELHRMPQIFLIEFIEYHL